MRRVVDITGELQKMYDLGFEDGIKEAADVVRAFIKLGFGDINLLPKVIEIISPETLKKRPGLQRTDH